MFASPLGCGTAEPSHLRKPLATHMYRDARLLGKGQSLGYGSTLATSGRPLSSGSLSHHGLCECRTEPGGPCVFVETCERARSSWTPFWG